MGKLNDVQVELWAKDFYYYVEPAIPTIAAWLASAPTLPDRTLYQLIARNLAGEMGYIKEAEHHDLYVQFCAGLGITRDALLEHLPLASTIGAASAMGTTVATRLRKASAPSVLRWRWKSRAGQMVRR